MKNKQILLMKVIAFLLAAILIIHLGVSNANIDQHLMVTAIAIFNAILAILVKKPEEVIIEKDKTDDI